MVQDTATVLFSCFTLLIWVTLLPFLFSRSFGVLIWLGEYFAISRYSAHIIYNLQPPSVLFPCETVLLWHAMYNVRNPEFVRTRNVLSKIKKIYSLLL